MLYNVVIVFLDLNWTSSFLMGSCTAGFVAGLISSTAPIIKICLICGSSLGNLAVCPFDVLRFQKVNYLQKEQ